MLRFLDYCDLNGLHASIRKDNSFKVTGKGLSGFEISLILLDFSVDTKINITVNEKFAIVVL